MGNKKGWKPSDETREKMRLSHPGKPSNRKGIKISKEQIDALQRGRIGKPGPMKGKKQSPEARLKMSLAKRGKASHMLGKHHTEETKEKIRQKLIGKCYNDFDEEHRRKISEAKHGIAPRGTGWHHSAETIKKIGLANLGKKRSEETRKRIGLSKKGCIPSAESRKRMGDAHRGEKHFRWKGGRSKCHLGWTEKIRDSIRTRDDWHCLGLNDEHDGKLDVHHILPYQFCISNHIPEPHSETNLITLCNKHHMYYEWHPEEFVPRLLKTLGERYNYTYDYDGISLLMPALIDYVHGRRKS